MNQQEFRAAITLIHNINPTKHNSDEYFYGIFGGINYSFVIRPRQSTVTFYKKRDHKPLYYKKFYKYSLALDYLNENIGVL